ncbi:MAG TPA: hypothetical protein PKA55_04235 [Rhodoblastus sp.]|nr:hypothetical protein [Rhodoblastus sp.]
MKPALALGAARRHLTRPIVQAAMRQMLSSGVGQIWAFDAPVTQPLGVGRDCRVKTGSERRTNKSSIGASGAAGKSRMRFYRTLTCRLDRTICSRGPVVEKTEALKSKYRSDC